MGSSEGRRQGSGIAGLGRNLAARTAIQSEEPLRRQSACHRGSQVADTGMYGGLWRAVILLASRRSVPEPVAGSPPSETQGILMRLRLLLPLLALLWVLPARVHADVVGLFDGLDPMTRRSDAVLLMRIDEHVETPSLARGLLPNTGSLWYVEDCTVLKVFKGHLTEGERVRLRLFHSGVTGGFGIGSHHVVFLTEATADARDVRFQALKYENSHIQVSPNSDPAKLAGKSLKESLRLLVSEYRQYRMERAKREDAFFTELFK